MRAATVALFGVSLLASCDGATGGDSDMPTELPLLTLSDPALEIGVVEGPDEYVFGAIESVVRLSDRSIAVSDAGATRISIFAEDGTFLRRWGREGGGPGEFEALSRIYPFGTDSLLAAERWNGRLSLYDLHGSLGRLLPGSEISGDTTFVLDSWLYGRFWVEGALAAAERRRVRSVLDGLPDPRADAGYRVVRVDRDGGLWVREPAAGDTVTWTRLAADGRAQAVVAAPVAFRPTDILGDDMLGVWTGGADVSYVRAYHLVDTGETRPTPAWLLGSRSTATAEAPPDEEALLASMRGAIQSMARAQEIHYSTAMSYTTSLAALSEFELPEALLVDLLRGDARGWAVVFTHPAVDRLCALAYGYDTPPGWRRGSVACGPATRPNGSAADSVED